MGAIKAASVVVTVATIVGLGVSAVEPHMATTEQQREQTTQQQQVDNGADAIEQDNERKRAAGDAHGDAELDERNRPAEIRPKEDLPHIKIRFRP